MNCYEHIGKHIDVACRHLFQITTVHRTTICGTFILLRVTEFQHVWKGFSLTSCQHDNTYEGLFVHGLTTMRCCQLELYAEEAAFRIRYVSTMLLACKLEADWKCDQQDVWVPFRPFCNKPSTLPYTDFSKSPVILAFTAALSLFGSMPVKNLYYPASLFIQ
jgi:hypothetical protein